MPQKVKLLMTGGHAGGFAYAIVDEVVRRKLDWQLDWVGPRYAVEGSKVLTIEAKTMGKKGVTFHGIVAGKLQKRFTRHTLPSLLRVPLGFVHAAVLVGRIRPDVVLSFGGYAAVPVVIAAWLSRIPVVVHEQITGLGLANRLSAPFARKVLLAREEGLLFVKHSRKEVVGNPIRASIFKVRPKAKLGTPPRIFVFTGSRASQIINDTLSEILPQLLGTYTIDHLTGNLDYDKFVNVKKHLPANLRSSYTPLSFIDPDDVYKYYAKSDIVIARAGANTIAELLLVKRPAIVIPFPYINFDEQTRNAVAAKRFGLARVLPQSELTPGKLLEEIEWVTNNWQSLVTKVKGKKSPDVDSAGKVVDVLVELVK